jgi:hypothetical protein
VFLLRMLAVKNSQKRSEAFGSDRNNVGGLVVTVAKSRGPSKNNVNPFEAFHRE